MESEPDLISVAGRYSCAFHRLADDDDREPYDHSFTTIQHHGIPNDSGGKGAPIYKVGHGKTPTSPTSAVFRGFQANLNPNIGIIRL